MRFAAPRSASPSPIRWRGRSKSSYGVHSDSDSDDETSSEDEDGAEDDEDEAVCSTDESSSEESDSSSSTDTLPAPLRPTRPPKTPAERRHTEETIAAIRLRSRYHDPFEDWERQTRKDAYKAARKERSEIQAQFEYERDRARASVAAQLDVIRQKQTSDVHRQLEAMRLKMKQDEEKLREAWKARDQKVWERVEGVIKMEEDKVLAKMEAERKVREAEEAKRRAEEEKKKAEEERKKAEADKKRKEEEERKRQEEEAKRLEDERKRKEEEQARIIEEERKKMGNAKNATGFEPPSEDWVFARSNLKRLKEGPMKTVKGHPDMKKAWNAYRRKITPKIGQVTNDAVTIARVSSEIFEIITPNPSHPEPLYYALLSSLSKAILLQAETEVTAEKKSAIPLAQVTANLLGTLASFPEIFYAKLAQRAGGWLIPYAIPDKDIDGTPWPNVMAKRKAMGYRDNGQELEADYLSRVGGMMRVYFQVLKIKVDQPLNSRFETSRCWVWFARMMSKLSMLRMAVAPALIYAGLDVMGSQAKDIWGHQWIKILALLYEGVTKGFGDGTFVGGDSGEGKAGRVRVQLEIERIMNS